MLLILLLVALAFRSVLAPLVVLGIAAIGYLVYFPLLDQRSVALGFEVPRQLEPVLLALLLGVVTDYCVLFFSAFRDELDIGTDAVTSSRSALRLNATVIAVAGLTVAGGTISLLAAPFEVSRAPGPGPDDHYELAVVHGAPCPRVRAQRDRERAGPRGRTPAPADPRIRAADCARAGAGGHGRGRGVVRTG